MDFGKKLIQSAIKKIINWLNDDLMIVEILSPISLDLFHLPFSSILQHLYKVRMLYFPRQYDLQDLSQSFASSIIVISLV